MLERLEAPDTASQQQALFWEPESRHAAEHMSQSAQNLPGEGSSLPLQILDTPPPPPNYLSCQIP